ncbi:MAG: transposase, partial [Terriglobales bacterium]
MSDDSTTECLLFPGIFLKPVIAQFDQREGSSDGGALLLKAANQHYRLVEELTAGLRDERQAGKVDHTLQDLVAQRVFSIACGYPDGNDSARLGSDPIHKLLLGRDPIEGLDLASQPTVSRFENAVGVKELYRMGETLARSVIRRHAKRLRRRVYRVTID